MESENELFVCQMAEMKNNYMPVLFKLLLNVIATEIENVFFKVKDKQWGGEFLDLTECQEIMDRSILNMIVVSNQP